MQETEKTTSSIIEKIINLGPFLPGSVRKTKEKRTLKNGKIKVYEAQPIYTYTDLETGKQKQKRIKKSEFDYVYKLTQKHKEFKKLIAEFELAAIKENLSSKDSKKTNKTAY